MRRIPLNVLTKELYELLTANLTVPVYDDVPPDAVLPYVTFGLFTCKTAGTKVNDITDVTINIDIWSDYQGKSEVNTIAHSVIGLLNQLDSTTVDLTADNFAFLAGEVDFFEAFAEDGNGYHGVITYLCKIGNME